MAANQGSAQACDSCQIKPRLSNGKQSIGCSLGRLRLGISPLNSLKMNRTAIRIIICRIIWFNVVRPFDKPSWFPLIIHNRNSTAFGPLKSRKFPNRLHFLIVHVKLFEVNRWKVVLLCRKSKNQPSKRLRWSSYGLWLLQPWVPSLQVPYRLLACSDK